MRFKKAKGNRCEIELFKKLNSEGYVCHRVAGSGTHCQAVCDLVALKNGESLMIEVKSRRRVYKPNEDIGQLRKMIETANRCGAKPILAVRLNFRDWQMFDLNEKIPDKVV